jgi:hypothetical protein
MDAVELDHRKDQVMTVCKVTLTNLAMWVRDRYFPTTYAHATLTGSYAIRTAYASRPESFLVIRSWRPSLGSVLDVRHRSALNGP